MSKLDTIRLATPEDIDRVALVAAAGFYHSPTNAYERPHRDKYPRDTFANYRTTAFGYLRRPDAALYVIEDEHNEDEDTKLYPALRSECGGREWREDTTSGKVIVGYMSLIFEHESHRIGCSQPEGDLSSVHQGIDDLKRDQSPEGVNKLWETLNPPFMRYMADMFTVDEICVHPMYWRRGNGSALLKFAISFADEDAIPIGIFSAPMGVKNAAKVGFKECEVIEVEGYYQHPGSFKMWIGIHEPTIPATDDGQSRGEDAWDVFEEDRSFNAYVEDASDDGR